MDRWITDTEPSERFPVYTRANADEAGPEPFSPLGWTLAWEKGVVPGVADGFVAFGMVTRDELREDPETFGSWGGYLYNQVSLPRLMGVRMPGGDPHAIDVAYFGDRPDIPPYVPDPRDESPAATARLGEQLAWIMAPDTTSFDRMDAAIAMARRSRESRPDLSALSDAELVARARASAEDIRAVWNPYTAVVLAASIGPGAVAAVCAAVGRPEAAVGLFGALGGVESADATGAVWELSRLVRRSPSLTAAFDAGVDGLLGRLGAPGAGEDAAAFLAAFDRFLTAHGHRAPTDFDLMPYSWESRPELALAMVERVRLQDDDASPAVRAAAAAAERERLVGELEALVAEDPEALGTLRAGIRSGTYFYQLREAGKAAAIRVSNECKAALFELGRRGVEAGALDDPQQLFLLLESELDDYVAEPKAWRDTIAERERDFRRLAELEPPYIVNGPDGVPPISAWPERNRRRAESAVAGDVLTGIGASGGTATGRARIVRRLADAESLEPGDVMVCPTTDPSWVPLFMTVSAVVCDIGAMGSHAAIVSRELGVPCVVSVADATSRIDDGALVEVDGTAGTVRLR